MIDLKKFEEEGYCVIDNVLSKERTLGVRNALWASVEESNRRGSPTTIPGLDPNAANVRVFNLLDLDPVFVELIQHPLALECVVKTLGDDFLISNFTANIALPGSGSMVAHSDLAAVFPGPWLQCWSVNVIWCLDDVYAANGATRYLPGSHAVKTIDELPENMLEMMVPFEASQGSVILMDGRLWHTSGENGTESAERALLFGYYAAPFLRPQVNWNVLLSESTKSQMSEQMHHWLGLGPSANIASAEFVAKPK